MKDISNVLVMLELPSNKLLQAQTNFCKGQTHFNISLVHAFVVCLVGFRGGGGGGSLRQGFAKKK